MLKMVRIWQLLASSWHCYSAHFSNMLLSGTIKDPLLAQVIIDIGHWLLGGDLE